MWREQAGIGGPSATTSSTFLNSTSRRNLPRGADMHPEKPVRHDHHLRVAAVQMESKAGDKQANFVTIESFVEQAARQSVRLVAFPECCITGYWFIRNLTPKQLEDLAEPIPAGISSQRLMRLAKQYQMGIGAGLVEAGEQGFFHNTYVVAMPNGDVHCHRKLQAFEHPLVKSGTKYTVFDTPDGFR